MIYFRSLCYSNPVLIKRVFDYNVEVKVYQIYSKLLRDFEDETCGGMDIYTDL
jgi:hypothetical protein